MIGQLTTDGCDSQVLRFATLVTPTSILVT